MADVVDAHHHFWAVSTGRFTWPPPELEPIYRDFGPGDLDRVRVAAGVSQTVVVQTRDTLEDTDEMLAAARAHPWIAGVVAWVPLTDVAALEDALAERAGGAIAGVRHQIHREPDRHWLRREDVAPGLRALAAAGLPFDVVGEFPLHLDDVPAIADGHPDLILVIDHLAKPPVRGDGMDAWALQMVAAAKRPNVVAKISGLDTGTGPGWTLEELRPTLDAALEWFGPGRLIFGTDWPVSVQVSEYGDLVDTARAWTAVLSPSEQAAILADNARRVYGLAAP